jgi:hypothetical protein
MVQGMSVPFRPLLRQVRKGFRQFLDSKNPSSQPERDADVWARHEQTRHFVREVWHLCLDREPNTDELNHLSSALVHGSDFANFFLDVANSPEAIGKRSQQSSIRPGYPIGHYYSPVVDPDELAKSSFGKQRKPDELLCIDFNYEKMKPLIATALTARTMSLPEEATPEFRYYVNNDMFGIGDAIVLSAFLSHFKPANWIEVGSGFSSAILLDTLDRDSTLKTKVVFIEPNTDRLEALIRQEDRERVSIIKSIVQDVPLETYEILGAGDVLFLDTTHISKTGSDVNHEVFQILPRLKPGVIVHFHDVFDVLEYPDEWIYKENRSWNEQYLLRAFLMYNDNFEVLYANDAFAKHNRGFIKEICPDILRNPGGGLWLLKR